MEAREATDLAVQRIKEGRQAPEVVEEIVAQGVPEESARELVDRLFSQRAQAQAQEIAVTMLKAGKSKAEVWDALVAAGIEASTATALVADLGKLKDERDAEERRRQAAEASLGPSPYAYTNFRDGNETDPTKIITGFVLLALGLVVTLGTSSSGGRTIFAWGPIAFGIVLIIRGFGGGRR